MKITVELPCEVGDTLYIITEHRGIIESRVRVFWIGRLLGKLEQHEPERELKIRTQDYDILASDFGITAFLTKEEAEVAYNKR